MSEIEQNKRKSVLQIIDTAITKVNEVILGVSIAVVFLLVFINVVGRYFFSYTFIGMDEMARYVMITMGFLGMGLAMRNGNHSYFSILQDNIPKKARLIIRGLVAAICIAFMLVLIYLGIKLAIKYMPNRTESMRLPVGMWYAMIPAGAVFFLWHFCMILKNYVTMKKGADIEEEIKAGDALIKDSKFLKGTELSDDLTKEDKE